MSAKKSQLGGGQEQLAEALGCDVRTLRRWRKLPGAPTGDDRAEWDKFIAANGLGRDATKTKTQLQEDLLRRDIRLRDIRIAREEGATVPLADVREFLGQISAKNAQLLRTKYDTELPTKLQGKDIVAMRQLITATTDEVAEIVNRGLLGWSPSP